MGDLCCGSGRFLVGMLEEARARNAAVPIELLAESVVGADQSASAVAMARVNMLAYGLSHPEVFTVEDSIVDPAIDRLRGRMRLILTNPPFGDGKYDSNEGIRRTSATFGGLGSKERIDPSLAFVSRCVDLLAPQGVAGIILPDGVADGASMRQLLLDDSRLLTEVEVEGVVSLPSATFAPAGTTAKTSVVFIRKGTRPRDRVFMARADHVGHVMKKGSAVPDPEGDDLPGIADSVVATLSEDQQLPGDLGVLAADPHTLTSLDASSIDMGAVLARETLLADGGSSLSSVLSVVRRRRSAIRDDLPFISVLHLDELGNVDWQQAMTYRPTTPGVIARGGHVIVSLLNPAKFRAAVIPESFDEVQISAEFGVYDSVINSYAALALLQHPLVRAQIAPMGRGTSSSRRRVDAVDVLGLVGPAFDDDWVDKTGRRVHEALEAVAEARVKLTSAYGGGT
jgi:methylase of polypeptide subunit release factors